MSPSSAGNERPQPSQDFGNGFPPSQPLLNSLRHRGHFADAKWRRRTHPAAIHPGPTHAMARSEAPSAAAMTNAGMVPTSQAKTNRRRASMASRPAASASVSGSRDSRSSILDLYPPCARRFGCVCRTPAISCEAVATVPRRRGHAAAPCRIRPGAAASLVSFIALFGGTSISPAAMRTGATEFARTCTAALGQEDRGLD